MSDTGVSAILARFGDLEKKVMDRLTSLEKKVMDRLAVQDEAIAHVQKTCNVRCAAIKSIHARDLIGKKSLVGAEG